MNATELKDFMKWEAEMMKRGGLKPNWGLIGGLALCVAFWYAVWKTVF